MALIELSWKEVKVGETLPWPVYDKKNRLLFKKGSVITSEHQLQVLLKHGLYRKQEEDVDDHDERVIKIDPFQQIGDLAMRLRKVFENLFDESVSDAQQRVERICERIIEVCENDADAALGAVHLDHTERYTVAHPLNTALLCYLIGHRLGYEAKRIRSLLAAALTSNIGMIDLQEALQAQASPLTDYQRQRIRSHPEESVELLRAAGVNDELWLEVVLQHHERQDGKGYPFGIEGDEFVQDARVLALADRYHAMVSTRAYRESMPPTQALKQLFVDRGKEVDDQLAQLFIKEMGVYPPGSFVELANGDIGVVTRRGEDKMRPHVKSIITPKGVPYMRPMLRNTGDGEFKVLQLAQPQRLPFLNLLVLWDYEK